MDPKGRLAATRYIWTAFGFAMFFIMADPIWNMSGLGLGHVILGVLIAAFSFVATGMVWNWGDLPVLGQDMNEAMAKHKRTNRISVMLDDLNEDEMEELRRRLRDDADDAPDYDISADGELVQRG